MSETLLALFPDPKDLLALQPEDLGGVLLQLLPGVAHHDGKFLMAAFGEQVFRVNGPTYPQGVRRPVYLVLEEARAWLVSQGLVIHDPEQPADWLLATRRAKTLRTRADVEAFKKGRLLPVDLLQLVLAEKAAPQFIRGDHDVAVFQAFKEVEVAVRKAANSRGAGYPNDLVGVALMRKAFQPDTGPLTAVSLVASEREAEMHLFAGAIGHAKNPQSHRDVVLAPTEAARLIVFASHLLDIVEQRLKALGS